MVVGSGPHRRLDAVDAQWWGVGSEQGFRLGPTHRQASVHPGVSPKHHDPLITYRSYPPLGVCAPRRLPYHHNPTLLSPTDHGAEGARTPDLLGAIQALSQLSYSPERKQPRLHDGGAPELKARNRIRDGQAWWNRGISPAPQARRAR